MLATEIIIRNGQALAVYSDELIPYMGEDAEIKRAGHVEPDPRHRYGGNWYVDLRQAEGPLHVVDDQGKPFITREHALAFERGWLRQHVLKLKGEQDAAG